MEFEREIRKDIRGNNNPSGRSETRLVSDAERARRVPSLCNNQNELVDHGGNFNALDGTHPYTQEEADAADKRYLAEHPNARQEDSLVTRAVRRMSRFIPR